jgi:hypothetical protein
MTAELFRQLPMDPVVGSGSGDGGAAKVRKRKWTSSDGTTYETDGTTVYETVKGMPVYANRSQIRREEKREAEREAIHSHVRAMNLNPHEVFSHPAAGLPSQSPGAAPEENKGEQPFLSRAEFLKQYAAPPPAPPNATTSAKSSVDRKQAPDEQRESEVKESPYALSIEAVWRSLRAKRKLYKEQHAVRSFVDIAVNPTEYSVSEGELRFMKVVRTAPWIAQMNGINLDPVQHKFIEAFTFACAPRIYGKDWEANKIRFYEKYKLDRIHYQVLCMSPRRFGKTWSIAMFCLTMIWCVPGIIINVFSTNQRTSTSICRYIRKWLFALPEGKARLANEAKQEVWVIPSDATLSHRTQREKSNHPNKAGIIALPSSVVGTCFCFYFLSRGKVATTGKYGYRVVSSDPGPPLGPTGQEGIPTVLVLLHPDRPALSSKLSGTRTYE